MKRFVLAVLLIQMILCSCSNKCLYKDFNETHDSQIQESITVNEAEPRREEIRGVWISCFELPDASGGEEKFKSETDKIFKNLKKSDYNTAFVHVRPYADSIYPSEIFPWSKYCCNGKNPEFDPLKVIIQSAKDNEISVHAWINPFRISSNDDINSLPQSSPAKSMIESKSSDVVILPNGIYFNPASPNVHALIFKGAEEILKNYDVDAIHIDDYFYPVTDDRIDKEEYEEYKASGGEMTLPEWRKNTLSAFMCGLHSLTKKYDKILSVSPSGNLIYNEEKMYADVALWMGEKGYADMIIPQIYYGFKNEKLPFEDTAFRWANIKRDESVTLVCGIAQYKCKIKDSNAGKAGENEWKNNPDIIEEQKIFIKENNNFSGFADFSYSYIF